MTPPAAPDGYVAAPEEVAGRLALDYTTLSPANRAAILDSLTDAQADVETALNRPLLPTLVTLTNVTPAAGGDLWSWRTWPTDTIDDAMNVESFEANSDGTFTVIIAVGIDARAIPAIRSFVVRLAVEMTRANPDTKMGTRQPISVSADGQSITYSGTRTGSTTSGGTSTIEDLKKRWRRRLSPRIITAAQEPPWPYTGIYPGSAGIRW